MVERPDGHRVLLAPSREVADFVAATYTFDTVRIVGVAVRDGEPDVGGELAADWGDLDDPELVDDDAATWTVTAGPLAMRLGFGSRTVLGRLIGAVPMRIATSTFWAAAIDPIARTVMRGVRTRGRTGARQEWYAARDVRSITGLTASWDGVDLGSLTAVDPPVRFGFGSTPRRPSLVTLVTTVRVTD
jgi:hypothetical protein